MHICVLLRVKLIFKLVIAAGVCGSICKIHPSEYNVFLCVHGKLYVSLDGAVRHKPKYIQFQFSIKAFHDPR